MHVADQHLVVQVLRAKLWNSDSCSEPSSATSDTLSLLTRDMPAPSNYVNVCGVLLPDRSCTQAQQTGQAGQAGTGRSFIRTPALLLALHSLALGMQRESSILVSGPPGCGKSSLILELARVTGNNDVVELYMDAYVDSKALLGSYMCSSTPGEFFWQPGPLAEVSFLHSLGRPHLQHECGRIWSAGCSEDAMTTCLLVYPTRTVCRQCIVVDG